MQKEPAKKNIITHLRKQIFLLAAVFLMAVFLFSLGTAWSTYKRESKVLRDHYYSGIKKELVLNVQKAAALINFAEESYPASRMTRQEILKTIAKFRFGKNDEGYIFINTFDGTVVLLDTQKELVGRNLWDLTDPNGVKVIQEERKAAEKEGGDFIYYTWNKPSTEKLSPKISYVMGIPKLKWMIGAGLYIDDIEKDIAALKLDVLYSLAISIAIMILLSLILFHAFYFVQGKTLRMIKNDTNVFIKHFRSKNNGEQLLKGNTLVFSEFYSIAHAMNIMIEDKRRVEARALFNEKKFDILFSNISDVIFVTDKKRTLVHANRPALRKVFGYDLDEVLGKDALFLFKNYSEYEKAGNVVDLVKKGKDVSIIDHIEYKRKDGSTFPAEALIYSLSSENPEEILIVTINRDISKRIEAEEKLKTSLKQKEFLLKEVQHRVRNNLTIILGLISLEKSNTSFERVEDALSQIEDKIQTMSLAYNMLYDEKTPGKISAGDYLQSIFYDIISSPSKQGIKTSFENIKMDIDLIIPIGLIVNELLQNVIKPVSTGEYYNPELLISLKKDDKGIITLDIKAMGKYLGNSKPIDEKNMAGMALVDALTLQINGNLTINTERGIHYTLSFYLEEGK